MSSFEAATSPSEETYSTSSNDWGSPIPAPEAQKKKGCIRRNLILILTIVAVVAGISVGTALRSANIDPMTKRFLGLPGVILMSMFKGVVIPLIVVSVVAGISSMDPAHMGKINALALLYYVGTTLAAVVIALVLVLVIHPGDPSMQPARVESVDKFSSMEKLSLGDVLHDVLINLFPDNLFSASFETRRTHYVTLKDKGAPENRSIEANMTHPALADAVGQLRDFIVGNGTADKAAAALQDQLEKIAHPATTTGAPGKKIAMTMHVTSGNILGLLVFSFAFGIVVAYSREKGRIIRNFFVSLDYIIGRIVNLIIWYSSIGVFSLLVDQMLSIEGDSVLDLFQMMALYMATFVGALAAQFLLVMMPLYWLLTRKNPFTVVKGVAEMLAVTFGTASSAAALPVHMKCLEENLGVRHAICQMVCPVACTINMNGTAALEVVATIFIAQLNDRTLLPVDYSIIVIMATLAAVGAAAIPSAGLFTMVMILSALNIPIDDIALVMSVDWILDRIRTCINCIGDSYCACFLEDYVEKRGIVLQQDLETAAPSPSAPAEANNNSSKSHK